jgi:hypothetical protein
MVTCGTCYKIIVMGHQWTHAKKTIVMWTPVNIYNKTCNGSPVNTYNKTTVMGHLWTLVTKLL